ncbi:chromosome partitioning protein [Arthrobacter sp. RT-1]|uniref:polysaccharide biosynthesis tyrosine autokinase n=1 Tax=Arthrobacter sp. RT-1 TaxID=2292263 RepID=UPI000E385140|nr:polysaccharide biosynthesis tyrosine autokinase [Arthrobacter sp. RT-1]RDV08109.1 chromosome partitioning protein [Arthrobacter sp. RT-1]
MMQDFTTMIRRRWLLIVACTALGITAAVATLAAIPPTYTAETQVLVSLNNARTPAELEQGNNFIQARTRSYVVAARSPLVLDSVIDELGLPENAQSLARKIDATAELNTVVITISVKDASAVRATRIAESLVRNFIRSIEDVESTPDRSASLIKLSLISPATEPTSPSAPNSAVVLTVGTLLGLGLGLAVTLALTRLNFRIRDVRELGWLTRLPILGTLVFDTATPTRHRERSPLHFSRSESYRAIRNTILASSGPAAKRTMLVTSSIPDEGKSAVALDLADSLSQVGEKVILVDANFRCASLTDYLGLTPAPGLSDILNRRLEVGDALHKHGTHDVHVLTAGTSVPDPAEVIDSPALGELIQDLRHNYDTVILDASPLSTDADAAVLSRHVDGVILVVRLGTSSSRQLKQALLLLESSRSNVLGIIVNSFPRKRGLDKETLQGMHSSFRPTEPVRQRSGRII